MGKFLNKILYIVAAQVVVNLFCCRYAAAQQPDNVQMRMMPEIPASITEPTQRADFLAVHYWDKYDFRDSASIVKDDLLERAFVDFVEILSYVPKDTMDMAIDNLVRNVETNENMFPLLMQLTERYLYETSSPVCNEDKLIAFLQRELQSSALDETTKIRPKFLLESVMKNRVGDIANDLTYTLVDGQTGTLHAIKADYTLLYFNDPGCDECALLTSQLIASPKINKLIGEGKLKILTVYVNDDVEAWKEHASSVLHSWIYTRDAEQKINVENIYNIKQFPTVYLLDKDKKVLLKETTFEQIEKYFK